MAANQTFACLTSNSMSSCDHITANPDLSGIGVRIAFYLQSFMNGPYFTYCPESIDSDQQIAALLVVTSPKESVSIAWAGTLLTVSLVIAGIVGKFTSSLTLHHGTLIMK